MRSSCFQVLNVPFLNYLQGIRSRAGMGPVVRVGGNSQESTELFFQTFEPTHEFTNKTVVAGTVTPEVNIALDLYYAMSNISKFLDIQWYGGLPFASPLNTSGIASITGYAEQILGDNLIGLQMGKYESHGAGSSLVNFLSLLLQVTSRICASLADLIIEHFAYINHRFGIGARARPTNYSIQDFFGEWNQSIQAIQQNNAVKNEKILLGPSTCCNIDGKWSIDQVIAAGYMSIYSSQLKQIAVQYYPNRESRFRSE